MNHTHLLASNTIGPPVVVLFLGPIILGVLCLIVLVVKRSAGASGAAGRSRWGLILGLVPTIVGALLIFFLLTVRGGAPRFFYIAAALPLLVGIRILQVWNRPNVP